MLDVCQAFADESSFQFSMEKSNVVVFGHQDAAEEFTLGTKTVRQVRQYTYLGVELARSLGFWRSGKEAELLRGKRFVDDDEGDEERQVDFVFYNEEAKVVGLPSSGWIAATSRVDGIDDPREYFVSERTDFAGMIRRYSRLHPDFEQGPETEGPWQAQRDKLMLKIAQRTGLLRRRGCHA